VGRTGSIRAAGVELSVSHTVVSRHIKNLQEDLGVMLVRPEGRGVSLTEKGRELLLRLSQSFDEIECAVAAARPHTKTAVRIWCVPGIANRRLITRLHELTEPPKNWEVTIHPTLQRPDLLRREADAEIVYFSDALPDLKRIKYEVLSRPRFFPVASPGFLARYRDLRSPHDLVKSQLIHEESTAQWASWLKAAGVNSEELQGQRLWHAHLAIEAARLGHGLALANELLVYDELKDGRLVEPFPSEIYLGSYAFITSRDRWSEPTIDALREWLKRILV
jgi:DNA-binding transcriptional LysR family regulator